MQTSFSAVTAACALALYACVGDIDPQADPTGTTYGPDGTPAGPGAAGTVPVPKVTGCEGMVNPGYVVAHRLNRMEYNNTIRDLLKNTSRPADELPADVPVGGFDNNAANLNLDGDLLGMYQGAAQRLALSAVSKPGSTFVACGAGVTPDAACARKILEPFLRRAWRRNVTADEVSGLVKLVQLALDNGDTFTNGMALALEAVLVSPHFLYRFELPPTPGTTGTYSVDAYSVASRLSYFLWSSMPDDQLLAAAESKELLKPEGLAAQVARMLTDAKTSALADNMAGQWLGARGVIDAAPNPKTFPAFDPGLRDAIQKETSLFLQAFVQENLDLRTMMDAPFTFANERLGTHYGLQGVTGASFKKVPLVNSERRGGLLSHASFLVSTSKPDQPSIPLRGKWVLNNLLCSPPQPPPPDVVNKQADIEKALGPNPTRRDAALARDARPECGGCHARMDPIGLALDKYDAVGAWREKDGTQPIDPSGTLNGTKFTSAKAMFHLLKTEPGLPGCIAKAFFRFSLGRVTTSADTCMLDDVTQRAVDGGFKAQDLLNGLVQSPAFRFQNE